MGIRHDEQSTVGTMSQRTMTESQIKSSKVQYGLPTQVNHGSPVLTVKPRRHSQRYSMTSISSTGASSLSPVEQPARSAIPRPSGIPRKVSAVSSARLQTPASTRPTPTSSVQPAVSTILDQQKKLANRQSLRTMQTAQIKQALKRRGDGLSQQTTSLSGSKTDTSHFSEGTPPGRISNGPDTSLPPRLIPELQALAYSNRRPVQTPSSISTISSPSSQFTGSPSPWSASTNTTASTSWSSVSPSILQATRSPVNSKRSHTVPIPAISRTRMPSLPILQETATGSMQSSKTNLGQDVVTPPRKLKKSPAPTPPPRSSSAKRTRSRSNSKSEESPSGPISEDLPPPLPVRSEQRPMLDAHGNWTSGAEAHGPTKILAYHHDLQDVLYDRTMPHAAGLHETQGDALSEDERGEVRSRLQPPTLLSSAPISSRSQDDASLQPPSTARSRLAKFSKLALFGRSSKESTSQDEAKPHNRKLQRKGPAAGTGHEGYGRYGRKPRKISTDFSNAGTDSDASVASTNIKHTPSTARKYSSSSSRRDRHSQSDLDDFAASRMKPVVMKGGSQLPNGHSRGSLGSAEQPGTIRVQRDVNSPMDETNSVHYANSPEDLTAYVPAVFPDQIISDSPSPISQPMSMIHPLETYRLPEAARQQTGSTGGPYIDSWNVSQSSFAPSYVTSTDAGSDIFRIEAHPPEKQRKKIRRSKWNIFRKRDTSIESNISGVETPSRQHAHEVAVTVAQVPISRTVPYYAMLDSENDANDQIAVSDLLNEATQPFEADDEDGFDSPQLDQDYDTRERIESVLLPSAPQFKREISRSRNSKRPAIRILDISENVPSTIAIDQEQRQPRLAPVGRIPKVVATSHSKQLNRKSFSRPFNRPGQYELPNQRYHSESTSLSPDLSTTLETLPSSTYNDLGQRNTSMAYQYSPQIARAPTTQSQLESFKFYDRQSTTSSSSDGIISVMGPSMIPQHEYGPVSTPKTTNSEDVWNEYDDLLDHVATNSPERKPITKIHEGDRITSGEWQSGAKSRSKNDAPSLIALAKGLAVDTSITQIPIILDTADLTDESCGDEEIHLRRSRIVSALHSSMDPSSPFSIGDYLSEHGARQRNSDHQSGYLSVGSGSGTTTPKMVGPSIALPAIPDNPPHVNTVQSNDAQHKKNTAKHSELSYASLMISRWLSFGQVLFSPAHVELQRQSEKQVLVIDGLGNDDWSVYCAVTYQAERAYVYDLKETGRSNRGDVRTTENVPPNFRRREIASFYNAFNFPDNFFSVVVVRFPPVMAESKLKNIISECRRVLAPGGYIELMLLDLDIVNMGILTRRAMRDLKTNMTMTEPDVSLRPLIDNIQHVLGDKGFSKLNRCVVGVPVVGQSMNSADSPVSSRSSGGSDDSPFSPTAGPRPFDSIAMKTGQGFSLHNLVADHSDGADAKISKLVSRTARNWWQRCFEGTVISDDNPAHSIFANKQVLSECKSRASNFKLLIAYAQKPLKPAVEAKRRTMSEPYITTPAPSR